MFQTLDDVLIDFADRAVGGAQTRFGRTLPEVLSSLATPVAAGWAVLPFARAWDSHPFWLLGILPWLAVAVVSFGLPARRFAQDAGKDWDASLSRRYFGFSEGQRLGNRTTRLMFLFAAFAVLTLAALWTRTGHVVRASDVIAIAVHLASPVVLYCYCARPRPPGFGRPAARMAAGHA